jgi:HAD superfamily phosphatase (TIGR01668 family)
MIHYLVKISKFVPLACYKTVYDIDYIKLYDEGCRIILFDLDNTLIPYDEFIPQQKHLDLFKQIKDLGIQIIIISNNRAERVKLFADAVECNYVYSAMKPLKSGYKKALNKISNYENEQIVSIGDQLMTDVLGSNRNNLRCILVKPIKKKTEKWYTRLNRRMEESVLKRIKKHYPKTYEEIKKLEEIND